MLCGVEIVEWPIGMQDMIRDAPPLDDLFWEPARGGPGPQPDPYEREENERYLRRAIDLLERLVEEQPTIPDYQHLLACCYRDLPPTMPFDTDGGQSEQIDRAIEILEKLAERFPAVPAYQHDLAKTYLQASSHSETGAFSTAPVRLHEALRVTQKLVTEHPNEPGYVLSQVQVHLALSEMFRRDARPAAAEAALRQALSLQSSLVSRFPDNMPYEIWKAMVQISLAESLTELAKTKEARSLLESTISELHAVPKVDSEGPHHGLLERSYEILAKVYRQLGQEDRADEVLRQVEQYRDPRRGPPHFPPE